MSGLWRAAGAWGRLCRFFLITPAAWAAREQLQSFQIQAQCAYGRDAGVEHALQTGRIEEDGPGAEERKDASNRGLLLQGAPCSQRDCIQTECDVAYAASRRTLPQVVLDLNVVT